MNNKMTSMGIAIVLIISGNDKMGQEYKISDVIEIEANPPGLVRIVEPGEVTQMKNEVGPMLPKGDRKISKIELITCSVKANVFRLPPFVFEEAIALATSESGSTHLVYVVGRGYQANGIPAKRRWHQGTNYEGMLTWIQHVPRPDEIDDKLITKFIRETNFGNNELHTETRPIKIFLYARWKSKSLLDSLQKGIGSAERHNRWQRSGTRSD